MVQPVEVLVRAADTPQATYLYVRWLDNPDSVETVQIAAETLTPLLDELGTAMMSPLPGEDGAAAAHRALTSGPFIDVDRESDLSARFAKAILPQGFWETLADRGGAGEEQVRVRVTPSQRLARIPWELLHTGDGRRLLEQATLVYEVPSTIHWRRDPLPTPWEEARERPALATIDPRVPVRNNPLGSTLTQQERTHLIADLGVADHGQHISRDQLAALLQQRPSTWLYFGHVSLNHTEPGSASLHLTDGTVRLADGSHGTYAGTATLIDTHRPLTALDLLLGTSQDLVRDPKLKYVADENVMGHRIWPMPPRVALIACESGGDHASSETFGLVVAAHTNGAEYVTATRWTLPTDHAMNQYNPQEGGIHPTSDLARGIHRALSAEDPIAHIRDWQIGELEQWKKTGSMAYSPLLFTSIATHHAPPRNPDGSPFTTS